MELFNLANPLPNLTGFIVLYYFVEGINYYEKTAENSKGIKTVKEEITPLYLQMVSGKTSKLMKYYCKHKRIQKVVSDKNQHTKVNNIHFYSSKLENTTKEASFTKVGLRGRKKRP